MLTEKLIFWTGAVMMFSTIIRTTLDITNPSKAEKNILNIFNDSANKFWIGIAVGYFYAALMIGGFYFAKFGWLFLTLGVFNILSLTLVSLFVILSRKIDTSDRLKEDYWQKFPSKVAKRLILNKKTKLLKSVAIFVIWIIAWL